MPYYCTVPRCTSMAGKAKNVSFHQFPRDEELAKLWNKILKRGKPYTKYSKVCSLHFKPEDYTITSVGKNKGQWRTLRKDAIPSQNLPSDSPMPYQRSRQTVWMPNNTPSNIMDPRLQQQMAQAIYMQTMLAMQAAGAADNLNIPPNCNEPQPSNPGDVSAAHTSKISNLDTHKQSNDASLNDIDNIKNCYKITKIDKELSSYKCDQCSKCFKDPDVFILHKRTHTRNVEKHDNIGEKENYDTNSDKLRQETLKANPILANLLKSGLSVEERNSTIDSNTILSIENQIMSALAANMESYIRNLSNLFNQNKSDRYYSDGDNSTDKRDSDRKESDESDSNNLDTHCDNNIDLNDSIDSNNLVIDENV